MSDIPDEPFPDTLEHAIEIACQAHPELDPDSFTFPEQGQQNFVFFADDKVIRLPRNAWTAQSMPREVQALGLLKDCPVKIPQVIDYDPDVHIMILTKVRGAPLDDKAVQKMSKQDQKHIAKQLAQFMSFIHQGVRLTPKDRDVLRSDSSYFHKQIKEKLREIEQENINEGLDLIIEDIQTYLFAYETLEDSDVLIHGDIMFSNILYDPDTKDIGIVDFTGMEMGYRHLDFRKLLDYPRPFFDMIIESYQDITGITPDLKLVKTAHAALKSYHREL